MKKALFLLIIVFLISSCSKDDVISNQIIGSWKLTEAKSYGFAGLDSIDYSAYNIIYDFKSNGILVVSGGNNAGYDNGEYEYIFEKDQLAGKDDPKILLVKIADSKWTYDLTNGKMTLGQAYLDGPNLIFERK